MRVYVAGPYTNGDPVVNVKNAIDCGDRLLEAGHTPFIPHLTMFWHLLHNHDLHVWYAYDLEWLQTCQALIRLPGLSGGADVEVHEATKAGIPVYRSVAAFLDVHGVLRK